MKKGRISPALESIWQMYPSWMGSQDGRGVSGGLPGDLAPKLPRGAGGLSVQSRSAKQGLGQPLFLSGFNTADYGQLVVANLSGARYFRAKESLQS